MSLLITCRETTTALECDLTCLLSLELTVCDNCCNAAMSELSFERSCLIDWVKSCISRAGSPNKLLPLATVPHKKIIISHYYNALFIHNYVHDKNIILFVGTCTHVLLVSLIWQQFYLILHRFLYKF